MSEHGDSTSNEKNLYNKIQIVTSLIMSSLFVIFLIYTCIKSNRDTSYDNYHNLKEAVSQHPITVEKMYYEFTEIHSEVPFSIFWKNKSYSTPFLIAFGYEQKQTVFTQIKPENLGLSIENDKRKLMLPFEYIDFDPTLFHTFTMLHSTGSICVKVTNGPIDVEDEMSFQTLMFDENTGKAASYKTRPAEFVDEELCKIIILKYPDDFSAVPDQLESESPIEQAIQPITK